ncbi:MAG: hypothetical protein ACNA7M_11950 [Roseovarius sp.]
MMRKVNIQSNQKVTTEDFNNLGNHPRETMDAIVKDVAGFPTPRYSGMAVEQLSVSTVRVSAGRFLKPDGSIYTFDFEGGHDDKWAVCGCNRHNRVRDAGPARLGADGDHGWANSGRGGCQPTANSLRRKRPDLPCYKALENM